MKRYLLAAAAATAIVTPAQARDGQPYFGIEGGILLPRDNDADADVNTVAARVWTALRDRVLKADTTTQVTRA